MASGLLLKSLFFEALLQFIHVQVRQCTKWWILVFWSGVMPWPAIVFCLLRNANHEFDLFSFFADYLRSGIVRNPFGFDSKHWRWETGRRMLWWESHNISGTTSMPGRVRYTLQGLSQAILPVCFANRRLYIWRAYYCCFRRQFDHLHEHFITEWFSQPDFYTLHVFMAGKSFYICLRSYVRTARVLPPLS